MIENHMFKVIAVFGIDKNALSVEILGMSNDPLVE